MAEHIRLHNRKFISIKQFTNRLKILFGATGDIFNSYTKIKKLCVKRRENIVDYIEKAQIVDDNIIKAEKSEKESLTDSDVCKINYRFVHAFYCGLSNDIRMLVEKRNDLSSIEMYEMVEKANQEFEVQLTTSIYLTQISPIRIQCSPKLPQKSE